MAQIKHRVSVYRPDCSDALRFVDTRNGVVYENRAAGQGAKLIVILPDSDVRR